MTSDRWERIKALFELALEQPAAERAAFVAVACGDDEDLRAEVMRLVSRYEPAGEVVDTPRLQPQRLSAVPRAVVLRPGARLGPYEIVGLAGHGGMGEVYRARDTRLGRQVAIKVIGSALDEQPDTRRRFDVEVRLAARLDHPRICAVYDVGQHDGIRYFVMEFVEGESLAARLRRGPLPIGELLEYATQIASALAYAHRHGVLHRDVKPGNILLTASGVKIVDFGLAKLLQQFRRDRSLDDGDAPTLVVPPTRAGSVYGTPEYISPERLEGREGDHRSDIFAFGTVLYEMATGRRAFDAPTPVALIAAIMSADPPPLLRNETGTPELEWVIRRCLQKNPDARWDSMGDVEAVLKWLASGAGTGGAARRAGDDTPSIRTHARRPSRAVVAVLAATALACAALVAAASSWWSPSVAPLAPVVRFTLPVEPRENVDFGAALSVRLALSRDGRRLAYVSQRGRTTVVYLRQMASSSTVAVEGTEGATSVFFSPDGEHLGFFAAGKLKKVNLRGGPASTICDVGEGAGAAWAEDDTIIFAPSSMSVLMRVSASGGKPEPATALQDGEVTHRWPEVLPGGTAILYAASRDNNFASPRIIVQSLHTNARTELVRGTYPRYASSGHIVFARDASLFALPFDPARLRARGGAQPIVPDLRMNNATGAALFAVAKNTLVYRAEGLLSSERAMVWVGKKGAEELIPLEPRAFLQPRLSPDGTRVAVSVGVWARDRDIWIYDFVHRALTRLAAEPGEDETAVWSPDGRRVAFSSAREGEPHTISVLPADGGSQPVQLYSGPFTIHVNDWSPDGQALAWTEFKAASGGEIRVVSVDGSGVVRTVLAGSYDVRGAVFSPDGRWLAYTSNESGRDEVYVQPYPGPGRKTQISTDGGREPVWSRDGRHLYFRGERQMRGVDVATSPTFTAGAPRLLFTDPYLTEHRGDRNYDVSPDGRFLMLKATRPFPPAEFTVLVNWGTTLERGN